jgi:hypothetical protein
VLFVVGAAGGLVGDAGHVLSGTTRYLDHGVPFVWESAIWFPVLVGAATVGAAELRLRLASARAGDAWEGTAAAASVIGIYALTAVLRDAPLEPATALVWALAIIVLWRFGEGLPSLACAVAAAIVGTVVEIVMVGGGVFEYANPIDGLGGVPPWLPGLYFAFGAVAARLGSLMAAAR